MEPKKNVKYDLERKSPLFYFIGLTVALICVTAAFEWRAPYDPMDLKAKEDAWEPPIDIVITRIPEPEPPKPPKPEKPTPEKEPPIATSVSVVDDAEVPDERPVIDLPLDDYLVDELEVPDEDPAAVFDIVESMPSFPGGEKAFYEYIARNVRFTRQARMLGVSGTVYVEFVIDEAGKITDVKALKGPGAGLDMEAVRVLENAPKWIPGKQRGRPVKVRMVVPIYFKLE